MKSFLLILLLAVPALSGLAAEPEQAAKPPQGPLNETEEKFVGKWKGSRLDFKWEIHRKPDRSFEIAFTEPHPEQARTILSNYATGVWWIDGKDYHFEWTQWWGDEGDFAGLQTEPVDMVGKDRIVTLSDDEEDPRNIEVRVPAFKLDAWKLKPDGEKAEPAKEESPDEPTEEP